MATTLTRKFIDLLINYKKKSVPLTVYIAGQQASLYGTITDIGKDFVVFANTGQDKVATVVIPIAMLSAVMPHTDLEVA